ncbi:MAG: galactitol system component [Tepidanaerobacteraceae bacterium]|nr:galactitol system component [Tepidanaerobacteraceae bacterium]
MHYRIIVANKTEFNNWQNCYKYLADLLLDENAVKPGYWESVYEREKQFPTGLQVTEKFGIAIPHPINPELCIEPSVAVAILSKPINVNSMADPNETISVSVVIMLALVSAENHLKMLQKLMETFQDEKFIETLQKIKDPQETKEIVKKRLSLF